ncbi:tyrosine-type recombinase/integrase [Paenibacillus polysaccharolyticus]|uniref:tyrosine-type recombinase/integrase n=1 Tax=Paenibacillus polysaccharolyticus TaxID=582692 RepID=UPI000B805944
MAGTVVHSRNQSYKEHLNVYVKKARIDKEITIHGLRHTHAVMMLESGASMKEVQKKLGHVSINVTSNIYAHITEVIEG